MCLIVPLYITDPGCYISQKAMDGRITRKKDENAPESLPHSYAARLRIRKRPSSLEENDGNDQKEDLKVSHFFLHVDPIFSIS